MLKNRYYVGVVRFDGVEYPGRHDPLISEELFDKCQRVRIARTQSREKPRVRTHYLKGTVHCGECGEPLSSRSPATDSEPTTSTSIASDDRFRRTAARSSPSKPGCSKTASNDTGTPSS